MLYNLINKSIKNNLLGKIGISYENMYETTVIMLSKAKQSKAKQSKAKQSHNCILSNFLKILYFFYKRIQKSFLLFWWQKSKQKTISFLSKREQKF